MWIIKWNAFAVVNILFNIALNHTGIKFVIFSHNQRTLWRRKTKLKFRNRFVRQKSNTSSGKKQFRCFGGIERIFSSDANTDGDIKKL